uniref:Uncharacterized protein n=1 Tax=Euplotes crassus TaxID=5936 RepID=A0A7S3KR93_EUPCR|mmetsp:Transcript_35332/g.34999  ORF Transcript_35332/g.34999 Transcript_35332/m.34999 type:complete len:222 (+) Transcript_35332:751-1416(+)
MWKHGAVGEPFLDGRFEFEAQTGFSTITGIKMGYIAIHFPDMDNTIRFTEFPIGEIHGLMKGTRTYDYTKTLKAEDETNGLYAECVFNPDKKGWFKRMFGSSQKTNHDYFDGVITDSKDFSYKSNRDEVEKMKKKHKIEVFARFEGNWTNSLCVDDAQVWNYHSLRPYKLNYINNPLPSDGRFRTDLIALLNHDFSKAQEQKDELENIQRNDRKLRKQANK